MFALPYLINYFKRDVQSAKLLELLTHLGRSASVSISVSEFSLSQDSCLANYDESRRELLFTQNSVDVYKIWPYVQVDSNNFNWLKQFKSNDFCRGKINVLLSAISIATDVKFVPEGSLNLGGVSVEVLAWKRSQRCLTLLAETTEENLSVIMSTLINNSGLVLSGRFNVQHVCTVSYGGESHEMRTRPPNILVFTGNDESSSQRFRLIKETLTSCLEKDKYVIYQLKDEQIATQPWMENTVLFILAVQSREGASHDDKIFYKFVENGGKLMSLGQEFQLGVTTSKLSEEDSHETNIFLKNDSFASSCDTSGIQCVTDVVFKVKAGEGVVTDIVASTKAGPVIVNVVYGVGRAVLSLVDLTIQKSGEDMHDGTLVLLKYLLTYLGLQCNNTSQSNNESSLLTKAYLLAEDETKEAFLKKIQPLLTDSYYRSKDMTLYFGEDDQLQTTPSFLPITTSPVPSDVTFSFSTYKNHLKTRNLGQIVIYSDVVTSTQTLLNGCLNLIKKLPRSFQPLALGRQQTIGKGRGGNDWLSPKGCLSFSIPVRIEQDSNLGCRLPFLQHIAALAVVEAVRSRENYQDIHIRIKWPNDIYCGDNVKIGGILVNSTFQERTFYTVVGYLVRENRRLREFIGHLKGDEMTYHEAYSLGIGVNLDNSEPTTCINDLARQQDLETFSSELLLACILNCMEELLDDFQKNGPAGFLSKYHQRWLHSGAQVKVEMLDNEVLTVKGLDDAGFLSVVNAANQEFSLQPDSNSFDMMKNLIAIKRH